MSEAGVQQKDKLVKNPIALITSLYVAGQK